MKRIIIQSILAITLAVFAMPKPTNAQQSGVTRVELQRHDLSIPNREMVQVRVELAPGTIVGNHSHPGEEIIYVVEGALEYTVAGKKPVTLKVGEVLFIPPGVVHSARNTGKVKGAELSVYLVDKDKPLLTVVK